MPLTIDRAQRDVIYELVLDRLSGLHDLWKALEHGDVSTATRLRFEFAQDLRLLDDLGWNATIEADTVELTMPPGELAEALARLHNDAAASLDTYVSRAKDDERLAQRHLAAAEALGDLLGRLALGTHTPDAS